MALNCDIHSIETYPSKSNRIMRFLSCHSDARDMLICPAVVILTVVFFFVFFFIDVNC